MRRKSQAQASDAGRSESETNASPDGARVGFWFTLEAAPRRAACSIGVRAHALRLSAKTWTRQASAGAAAEVAPAQRRRS